MCESQKVRLCSAPCALSILVRGFRWSSAPRRCPKISGTCACIAILARKQFGIRVLVRMLASYRTRPKSPPSTSSRVWRISTGSALLSASQSRLPGPRRRALLLQSVKQACNLNLFACNRSGLRTPESGWHSGHMSGQSGRSPSRHSGSSAAPLKYRRTTTAPLADSPTSQPVLVMNLVPFQVNFD